MGFTAWMALAGALLLAMALSSAYIQRLPITSSIVYLGVGIVLGPLVTSTVRLDLREAAWWFEPLTETAVIVALFLGGLKLRLPFSDPAWRAPLRLAGPVMLACIAGVAITAHLVAGVGLAEALLLGAVLAPTDPLLAGQVAVEDALDRSRMRYALSGEAGFNDGAAFPFVVLALELQRRGLGPWLGGWTLHRIVWAIPAGLGLGYAMGLGMGWLAIRVRSRDGEERAPNDFFALALIALTYVAAEAVGAWGFLAVFAAGVGLRRAEVRAVTSEPHPDRGERPEAEAEAEAHPPAEHLVRADEPSERMRQTPVAAGALVSDALTFGETCERLLEVLLVVLLGVGLAAHFDARGAIVAGALMLVLRPLATQLALAGSPVPRRERWLVGWLGIRGIGSFYYLAYALSHGVRGEAAGRLCALTFTVVAVSVVVHGVTAQPLLRRLEERGARERE